MCLTDDLPCSILDGAALCVRLRVSCFLILVLPPCSCVAIATLETEMASVGNCLSSNAFFVALTQHTPAEQWMMLPGDSLSLEGGTNEKPLPFADHKRYAICKMLHY